MVLHLSIDRQGNIFLWPVPLNQKRAMKILWLIYQRQIAEMAKTQWVRLANTFDVTKGIDQKVKFQIQLGLPYLSMKIIYFGSSHILEFLDHPALLKLWGAD